MDRGAEGDLGRHRFGRTDNDAMTREAPPAAAAPPRRPARRAALLVQSGFLLLVAQVSLRLIGYRRTRGLLGRLGWLTRGGRSRGLRSISWGVQRAAQLLPSRPQCLPQALVAERLLVAAGHSAELVLGVRDPGDRFAAHAWVRSGGQLVVGGDVSGYRVLQPVEGDPGSR